MNLTHNANRYPPIDSVPNFLRSLRADLESFGGTLIGYTFSVFPEDLELLELKMNQTAVPFTTKVFDGITVVTIEELNVRQNLVPTLLSITTPAQVLVSKITR